MSEKDVLQAALDSAKERFTGVYGGEITVYAAAHKPERKPWKKKPTPQDEAYRRALAAAEQSPPEK